MTPMIQKEAFSGEPGEAAEFAAESPEKGEEAAGLAAALTTDRLSEEEPAPDPGSVPQSAGPDQAEAPLLSGGGRLELADLGQDLEIEGLSVQGTLGAADGLLQDSLISAARARLSAVVEPESQPESDAGKGAFLAAAKVGASLDLSSLDGSNGFLIAGAAPGDQAGYAVSAAGDVNDDGFADILIGAPFANAGGSVDAGNAYVVLGSASGPGPSVDLAALDGSDGFVLQGVAELDRSGFSVSSAGDLNGDGIDDFLIGARFAEGNGQTYAGRSYFVFGKAKGFAPNVDLASLDGVDGFVLTGAEEYDQSGRAVASAGDINGDGFDDLLIGASFADGSGGQNSGQAYVVFGKKNGFSANLDLGSLDGSDGFVLEGASGADQAGLAVAGIGDVNGDGVDDLLIGAPLADPGGASRAGEAYVVYGRTDGFGASLDLGSLDGSDGFRLDGAAAGDEAGTALAAAGDVNGDGLADFIIGAPQAQAGGDDAAGKVYVVFGSTAKAGASKDLSTLDGSDGFTLVGIDADDYAGYSVASAGDVNGDGFDDLLIGAYGADPDGMATAGETYLIFGRGDGGFPAQIDLAKLDGSDGVLLEGISANDRSGRSVSGLGDINRDGFDDLIIGARFGDPGGDGNAGESYVVFGGTDFMPGSTLAGGVGANTLNGSNGADVILGLDGGDTLRGRGGVDQLFGGNGSDKLVGGGGGDSLFGGLGGDALQGQGGGDSLYGNAGADLLNGGAGGDLLDGGSGGDELIGGGGLDTLLGGAGQDILAGGGAADTLSGGAGADRLEGGAKADLLNGGGGGDDLLGGGGQDQLDGGGGADTLSGGAGKDSLTGGGGADTFLFEGGGGNDLVTDFLSLTDVLDVSDFGFADGAAVLAATSDQNGSAVITLAAGESITLEGVLKAELDQADFIV